MCQKLRNLVFHTLVPAVLAALLLPIMAFAQVSSCSVSIPVEIKVTGSRSGCGLAALAFIRKRMD